LRGRCCRMKKINMTAIWKFYFTFSLMVMTNELLQFNMWNSDVIHPIAFVLKGKIVDISVYTTLIGQMVSLFTSGYMWPLHSHQVVIQMNSLKVTVQWSPHVAWCELPSNQQELCRQKYHKFSACEILFGYHKHTGILCIKYIL
jgi:hypothetical protein